ncbi:thiol-disulfide oxidoreductase [Virgibacillus profundi]|uniref:Thiol-disulfide oxidoreductase n=2 Tax=Virgibacillus profundi TaxID=2024555 RepID=A0A2A2IE58_9BACI|nr:thiol-disulfide oxidoreductase [Virgibacillus profundi]PXY54024.1 TlpA family protein disulfide reductase [Virgibacillus profundi]
MKLRDRMPELEGATDWLNSKSIRKTDLIGNKPTLIHFWSISCDLCKEVMPNINEFRDEYKDNLNIIAVHMPRSEKDLNFDEIKQAADEQDMTQPILIDNFHKLTDAFKNKYVPSYYVFDSEGKLRHYQAGGGGMRMLRKRVNRVLGIKE